MTILPPHTILIIQNGTNMKNYKQKSKVIRCRQIIEAMIFLGIDPINFDKLKKEHGGLDGLFTFIAKELQAN